jgi:hypothetical protein
MTSRLCLPHREFADDRDGKGDLTEVHQRRSGVILGPRRMGWMPMFGRTRIGWTR